MAIEIERKFLVFPERLPELKGGQRIIQGYLCETPLIRFRLLDDKVIINIKKLLDNGSRFELETENPTPTPSEYISLQKMAIIPPIEKIRYRIPYEELLWEVDVYQGENLGLITADVELPSLDYNVNFPEWVDSTSDITSDTKYFNLNLGRNPISNW